MGPKDKNHFNRNDDGVVVDEVESFIPTATFCSICLDLVLDDGVRSWAKLQCGHQFHLDCIGSAFNAKGLMQCPNCRKTERGRWLYADGIQETNWDELNHFYHDHDEDVYDLSYPESSFGVQFYPFTGLVPVSPTYEDDEEEIAWVENANYTEERYVPYIGYSSGLLHTLSSNPTISIADHSNFNNHRNSHLVTNEPRAMYFPPLSVDSHNQGWDRHLGLISSNGQFGNSGQASVPHVGQISARTNLDILGQQSSVPHFHVGPSSSGGPSVGSSSIPVYPGSNERTQDRIQALEEYYQQISALTDSRTHIDMARVASSGEADRNCTQTRSGGSESNGEGMWEYCWRWDFSEALSRSRS